MLCNVTAHSLFVRQWYDLDFVSQLWYDLDLHIYMYPYNFAKYLFRWLVSVLFLWSDGKLVLFVVTLASIAWADFFFLFFASKYTDSCPYRPSMRGLVKFCIQVKWQGHKRSREEIEEGTYFNHGSFALAPFFTLRKWAASFSRPSQLMWQLLLQVSVLFPIATDQCEIS